MTTDPPMLQPEEKVSAAPSFGASFRYGLRARLAFIILLAFIPTVFYWTYNTIEFRRQVEAEAADDLMRLARFVRESYSRRIHEGHHLLAAISLYPELQSGSAEECSARLAQVAELYQPLTLSFGVADLDGTVLCTTTAISPTVNVSDRLWFREVVRTGEFAVGEFTIGRVRGMPVLGLGYPVRDENGELVRVLSYGLIISAIQGQADSLPLPDDAVLTIADHEGVILARVPDSEQWVGQRRADIEMAQMERQGGGVIEGTGVDGVRRLYAYTTIRGPGGVDVWMSLGRTPDVVYADVRQIITRDLIGLGAVLLAVLAAIWLGSRRLIMRPVRRLVAASNRLAEGDLAARATMQPDRSELGGLARAFNRMAEALQQRETELLERERHLHLALHAARMTAWTWDTGRDRIQTTDNFAEIYGTSAVEYAEQGFSLLHPDDRESHRQKVMQAMERQAAYHSEFRIIRPDTGQLVWLHEHAVPVKDEADQMLGFAGVAIDITEQKRAEEQLAYQAYMLTNVRDAVIGCNADRRITFWSRGAEEMYGWQADEVIGRPVSEVIRSEFTPEQQADALHQLETTGRFRVETVVHRRDGTPIYTDAINTALYGPDGKVTGYVTINRDITERRQAEEQLAIANYRYRVAEEAAKGFSYDWNLETCTLTRSESFERVLGYGPEELEDTWQGLVDIVHPDDRRAASEADAIEFIRDLQQDGYGDEYRIRHKDGHYIWVSEHSRTIRDENSKARRVIGQVVDITERKRLERELSVSRERFLAFMANTPTQVYIKDAEGRYLFVNRAVEELLSDLADKWIGNMDSDVLPDEIAAPIRAHDQIVLATGETQQFIEDVITAHGERRHFLSVKFRMEDENGQPCIGGISMDITEQRRFEQTLRESEERFRTLADSAPVLIWISGMEGTEFVNRAYLDYTGRTLQEVQGNRWRAVIHPHDRSAYVGAYETAFARRDRFEAQARILGSDGEYRWFHSAGMPRLTPAGEMMGYVGSSVDITRIKEAEMVLHEMNSALEQRVRERTAELERSNRELDQFAYVASHDLKAPLYGIERLAGFILEDAAQVLPEVSQRHLTLIRSRIKRMEALLSDLLAYSRAGRYRYEPERINLAASLRETAEFLAPPPGFVVEIVEPMPTLIGERVPLETVFRNLIGNAIKHHDNPAQGIVRVQAVDLGEWVEIAVSDNGPGIGSGFHGRIFEFFQTLKSRDQVEGSGLGLTMVKKIVDTCGGSIRVESEPGQGATFRFTWPKRPQSGPQTEPQTEAPHSQSPHAESSHTGLGPGA